MNDLSIEKTMTAKEISHSLGVSLELVTKKIKYLFPDIVKNGITTILNEKQIAVLKNEIEKNPHLVQTYEVDLDAQMTLKLMESANYFKSKYEETKKENELMKPKAIVYDKFLSSESWQTMNDIAHVIGVGRNRLYQILRDRKILMANNTPYQEYMDRGYFKVIDKPIDMNSQIILKKQTLVNAKGLEFISKIIGKISVTA